MSPICSAVDFRPGETISELHVGKQGLSLVVFNLNWMFNIPRALEEGVIRTAGADDDNYTTNVFLNKKI